MLLKAQTKLLQLSPLSPLTIRSASRRDWSTQTLLKTNFAKINHVSHGSPSSYKIPLNGVTPTKERQEGAAKEFLRQQQKSPTQETKPSVTPVSAKKSPQQEENDEEDDKPFVNPTTGEVNGPKGPEPTRYGDWAFKGRMTDF